MKQKIIGMVLAIFILFGLFIFQGVINSEAVTGANIKGNFTGTSNNATEGQNLIKKVVGPTLTVVRTIAYATAIVMLTYIGIKYMMAAPSEKADLKNQLITFTVGAGILFGAGALLKLIQSFANENIT